MVEHPNRIRSELPGLSGSLLREIIEYGSIKTFPVDTEILREGQFVKMIPIVIRGLVKVYTRYEGRELLLYYIRPKESCIMSFSAALSNEPSKIIAKTEDVSEVLLLPVEKVRHWTHQYNDLNDLFFRQYNQRYSELLQTIHYLLFNKMDVRLMSYLEEKVNITGMNPLKMSHKEIANELGTAREVISRIIKKLETEEKLFQDEKGIHIKTV